MSGVSVNGESFHAISQRVHISRTSYSLRKYTECKWYRGRHALRYSYQSHGDGDTVIRARVGVALEALCSDDEANVPV